MHVCLICLHVGRSWVRLAWLLVVQPLAFSVRYSVVRLWKRKKTRSALKLLEIDLPGLDQVLGQPGMTHVLLQETAYTFFLPLYRQNRCTPMNDARAFFYLAISNLRHWRNFHRLMPTYRCMCSELIFWCYCGRTRTYVILPRKLEILPTLVGISKALPSHGPSQQRQLLPKHSWV